MADLGLSKLSVANLEAFAKLMDMNKFAKKTTKTLKVKAVEEHWIWAFSKEEASDNDGVEASSSIDNVKVKKSRRCGSKQFR